MEPVQRGDPAEGAPPLRRLLTPSGAAVTIAGDVVTKLHRPGTDPRALTQRLRSAARSASLLSPLDVEPEPVGDRWRTRWPRVDTITPEPEAVPWFEAGRLLAALHTEPVGELALPHGGPARLARALARLPAGPTPRVASLLPADVIRRAAATLPAEAPDRPVTLVHGDFHLGQLGHHHERWVLIDVDDLGIGDPAADLGRPAGFWAAGLLPDDDWHQFLDGYRGGCGPALPAGDPWPVLEPHARAAVIAAAANQPDEALVAACAGMV